MNHKEQVVHVNRLKKAYDPEIWKPKQEPEAPKERINKRPTKSENQAEEEDIRIGSYLLLEIHPLETRVEPGTPPSQYPDTPESAQQRVDTPLSAGTRTTNLLVHHYQGVNCETRGQNRRLRGHELEHKHRTLA